MLTGSERQLQALDAVIHHGSHAKAAHALRISERALGDRLEGLRRRNGMVSTYQLCYLRGLAALQLPIWLEREFAII